MVTLFQSTRPAWGATRQAHRTLQQPNVSIHAPCVGRDVTGRAARRARACFNPRALRGARQGDVIAGPDASQVSIHAPCVGRDGVGPEPLHLILRVSIHAPCVGRDLPAFPSLAPFHLFQSTRPAWGATAANNYVPIDNDGFNPRALRGARQHPDRRPKHLREFQSTRPAWGATAPPVESWPMTWVSIHAPCVGRDGSCCRRAPRSWVFQSTRPAWGATKQKGDIVSGKGVSIHAPCVGRDDERARSHSSTMFQSTRPAWGATSSSAHAAWVACFNPRALRGARR